MKYGFVFSLLLLMVFSAGCGGNQLSDFRSLSNLKKGNEYLGFADRNFSENNLESALRNYLKALDEFKLIDYTDGKARALEGTARIYTAMGMKGEASSVLHKLVKMKPFLSEDIAFRVTLASAEYYLKFELADSLINITSGWNQGRNVNEKMQLLAQYIIALSERGSVDENILTTAKDFFNSSYQENPLDLEVEIQAMSLTAYAIGITEFRKNNLTDAEKYFQYSLQYDKAAGNYIYIADNLYLLGIVEERRSNFEKSGDYFGRAFDIYVLLREEEKAQLSNANKLLQFYRLSSEKSAYRLELEKIIETTKDKELQTKIRSVIK
ncbi:MAG: hypothetical protein IT279_00575 [Ignavibacteriaceae bacterium]|nr:hypothetical protein [Ignavibacteriaceae bacterium]